MIRDRLERIRERAYALWERAGGGHGRDEEHWHGAIREVDAEDDAAAAKPKRAKALKDKDPGASEAGAKPKRATKAKTTAIDKPSVTPAAIEPAAPARKRPKPIAAASRATPAPKSSGAGSKTASLKTAGKRSATKPAENEGTVASQSPAAKPSRRSKAN